MIALLNATGAIALFAAVQAVWLGSLSKNTRIFHAYAFVCLFICIFLLATSLWYSAETLSTSEIATKWQSFAGMGHVAAFTWLIAHMSALSTNKKVLTFLIAMTAIMAIAVIQVIKSPLASLVPGLEITGTTTLFFQEVTDYRGLGGDKPLLMNLIALTAYLWCLYGLREMVRKGLSFYAFWLASYLLVQLAYMANRIMVDVGATEQALPIGLAFIWLLVVVSVCYGHEHHVATATMRDQDEQLRTEISNRIAAEKKLRDHAYYDNLTSLPNELWLREELARILNQSDIKQVLLLIQIHDLRGVSRIFGDQNIDDLIKKVASRMGSRKSGSDSISRIGSGTFCIIADHLDSIDFENDSDSGRWRLNAPVIQPYSVGRQRVDLYFHVGLIELGRPDSVENVLYKAEQALAEAIRRGRNQIVFFNESLTRQIAHEKKLESDLSRGLEQNEFELYYQPKFNGAKLCVGAEALLRWRHGEAGMIPPDVFIPLAERSGFMTELGAWIIDETCHFLREMDDRKMGLPGRLSINISPWQLKDQSLEETLVKSLTRHGIDASRLELELTESALVDVIDETSRQFRALQERGIAIAIDDFGTGYSSLAYLQQLPLDILKIDKRFVDGIGEERGRQLMQGIIDIGHALKLDIIAEGVETEEQYEILRQLGCEHFQGYLFSKPLPAEEFSAWLSNSITEEV